MTNIYNKTSIYRNRLYKELEFLEDDYNNFQLNKGENNMSIIVFGPKRHNLPEYVEFIISAKYPFDPPFIYLHNKTPYLRTILNIPEKIMTEIREIDKTIILENKYYCACCFITRHWFPTVRLSQIIERMSAIRILNEKVACLEMMKKKNIPKEVIKMIISFV